MLKKFMSLLGLHKDVGGPAHAGANPVFFTYVYEVEQGFVFSWHDSAHRLGGVSNPYWTEAEAETARKFWEGKKAAFEKATFVRP
jgi:hypothetical protein